MSTPTNLILEGAMEDEPISASAFASSVETSNPESDSYITPGTVVLPPTAVRRSPFDDMLAGIENTFNSLFPILVRTGVIPAQPAPAPAPIPASNALTDTQKTVIVGGIVLVLAVLVLRKTL